MQVTAGNGSPGTAALTVISGMAGVGKTALAVHWARQAAGSFPDGQLYVNLRGFGPSAPMLPAEAVVGFLAALGVPPDRWPPGLDAQVGMYRSVAAGRRLLILLDNARDADQVRPLLPGAPGCLVVVTSRTSLAGLAVSDGARLLSLDVLTNDAAGELLTSRIGRERTAAEPQPVRELIRLCAGLPLALAIVAARACARPGFPLQDLVAELGEASFRLDALDGGDTASSVRAVISWSYESLNGQSARMFRLLGLHPGPDITADAAASAAGVTLPAARRCLRELAHASLLSEHQPGRFALHDLLRAYAAEQATATEDQQARHEATERILDHYLHTAVGAAALLHPQRDLISVGRPRSGVTPEHLAGKHAALAWMQAECPVLLAVVTMADVTGFDRHAWQVPWAMEDFLNWGGRWRDTAAVQRTALAAATRLGDTSRQAGCQLPLAQACWRLGQHDQALAHFSASLGLYQQLGDRIGEAKVHQSLTAHANSQGRYADALRHSEQALSLFRAVGDRCGEAGALNNAGFCRVQTGDYEQARVLCREAVSLNAELGQRNIEAHAWDSLGFAEHRLGNLAEAAECYERAVSLFREFGYRYFETHALTQLGDIREACGDPQLAREAWQWALDILDAIDHPDADKVRGKLGMDEAPAGVERGHG